MNLMKQQMDCMRSFAKAKKSCFKQNHLSDRTSIAGTTWENLKEQAMDD